MLIDETVELSGLKIHGSPASEAYGDLFTAFAGPASELHKSWSKIPEDLDMLVTHGPPRGILDNYLGSQSLFDTVLKIKPKVHIFGHIHEGAGIETHSDVLFVNASSIGGINSGPFAPIEIRYDKMKREVLSVEQTESFRF